MASWDELLGQKYAINQQQTDASVLAQQAQARETNTRAQLLPGQTAAQIALQNAQAAGAQAQADATPALTRSTVDNQAAYGAHALASADFQRAQIPALDAENSSPHIDLFKQNAYRRAYGDNPPQANSRIIDTGLAPAPAGPNATELATSEGLPPVEAPGTPTPPTRPTNLQQKSFFSEPTITKIGPAGSTQGEGINDPYHVRHLRSSGSTQISGGTRLYSKGTARVPGKGSGTVDTVKAMLAPGEAVLNKGAAEHLGRPMIAALNAIGMVKADLGGPPSDKDTEDDRAKPQKTSPPPKSTKDDRAHFAKGTSKVAKGKPSDTKHVDPQALLKIAAMLGGPSGRGMPTAQQPQPQPQQMDPQQMMPPQM
jgi:hypothetical protein